MKRIFAIFALHCIVFMPVVMFATPTASAINKNFISLKPDHKYFQKLNSNFLITGSQTPVADTNIVAKSTTSYATVYTNLLINAGTSYVLADGVATAFNNQFSTAIDANDAIKFWGYYENIAEVRNGVALSVEFRPIPKMADTIFYKLYLRQMPYALQIFTQNLPASFSYKAILVDNYLNTKKEINLKDTSLINFTPTADTNSYRNRFMLIFRKQLATTPVPVSKIFNQENPDIVNVSDKNSISAGTVSISPNPVSNSGNTTLRFNNMIKGNYEVVVYNSKAQSLLVKKIQHNGNYTFYDLQTGNKWSTGIYSILIHKVGDVNTIKLQLIVSK